MSFKPKIEVLEARETPALLSKVALVAQSVESLLPPPEDPTTPVTTTPTPTPTPAPTPTPTPTPTPDPVIP